ncbi:MAG: His/Gly/Thr/Pro-type tRNA ligase C-terminal domain-containing protein, partial [Patescibacteria group bacterium]
AAVFPVSDKSNAYAEKIEGKLAAENIRTETYERDGTIGKKIREAETQKIPYLIIVGEKEEKNETVALRQRSKGDLGEVKIPELIARLKKEIESKTL